MLTIDRWKTKFGGQLKLPGLAKSGFESVGKFGIGFFSIFMLGSEVKLTTRRYLPSPNSDSVHWQLNFDSGLSSRPALMKPAASEQLPRAGTRIAVRVPADTLSQLLGLSRPKDPITSFLAKATEEISSVLGEPKKEHATDDELASKLAWLVSRLCPASPVKLLTKLGKHKGYLSAAANDWISVDDDRILARSGCSTTPIFPLTNERGDLIGRIGLTPDKYGSGMASLVFHGVIAGQAPGLAGILKASTNNADARRSKTHLAGDLAAWKRWATTVLESDASMSLEQRLRLHPVVPEVDLKVWRWRGSELTLGELVDEVAGLDKFLVHEGDIEHDDSDEFSSSTFEHWFAIADGVVCIPSWTPINAWGSFFLDRDESTGRSVFPWSLAVEPIDYRGRLFESLKAAGHNFREVSDDQCVVGEVNGTEVYRNAQTHVREW